MAFEDVKSPLPPRRVLTDDSATSAPPMPAPSVPTPAASQSTSGQANPKVSTPIVQPKKPVNLKPVLIVLGILVAVVVVGMLVKKILTNFTGKTDTNITLNYWGLWEDSPVMEGVIADYQAKNPGVKIAYTRNQKNDYRSRLQGRLEKTGTETDVPDIFRIHSSWIPMFTSNLAAVPTVTANAIGLDTDYYNVFKNDLKISGQYWAIPMMYDGLVMFYNKDILDGAPSISIPKSWWDLEMAASKLTVRDPDTGVIKVAGAAMGLTDNVDNWSDILGLMLKQSGVDILASDPTNTKKLQDVLTYYTLFATKDKVWDASFPNSTEAFAKGKVAFYLGQSWRVFNIEDMKVPGLHYEVTTAPQLPTLVDAPAGSDTNLTNIHWSTYWVEGVNVKSKKQAEAWKFLEYLSTKEVLAKLYTTQSQIRAFGEIYPRKSMATQLNDNPKLKAFTVSADNASGWYLSSKTWDDGLNDNMIKYFGDAINGMLYKSQQVDQVMPDLRSGINQLKQRYNLK
ncbi:extracellular solute-binding protein [Candidatus Shapirobacteria bacterium]|nr:extracellular solute-binding protein [Candidatus Shapirobacteria bacterium]